MKAVTKAITVLKRITRTMVITPGLTDQVIHLVIANDRGDEISTYLTNADRKALIEALGGTA